MHHMLKAIPSGASLILVGDAHQLPSVGPGTLPVVELTDIFRQSETSSIVTNAHRISLGLPLVENDTEERRDFFFIEQEEPSRVAEIVVELACRRIPRRFHLDPVDDVHVFHRCTGGRPGWRTSTSFSKRR